MSKNQILISNLKMGNRKKISIYKKIYKEFKKTYRILETSILHIINKKSIKATIFL